MISDIGVFQVDGCFQLAYENGDLKGDNGLETAVSISLFTDMRVDEQELPDGLTDRRGFWGDMYPTVNGDKIGSKLWTLSRSKRSNETLAKLETFAKDSLEWMIDDGVAESIAVLAEYNENNHAIASISISRPTGDTDRFSANWDSQKLLRL